MKFTNQYNINTVNAEIIRYGYALSVTAGCYMLHTKKRGQPDGKVIHGYSNKTKAMEGASRIINTGGKSYNPDLITAEEVGAIYGIARQNVYYYVRNHKLPAPIKPGLWSRDAVTSCKDRQDDKQTA